MDTNHNVKNFRYQIVVGSSLNFFGNRIVDINLLCAAGISHELYRIQDFSPNIFVLNLTSAETANALHGLLNTQDSHALSRLCMILYFMRLNIFTVDTKTLNARTRVTFMWSSFIWMTSMHNVFFGTKRNMASSTIGMCFLMIRSKNFHPCHNTLEASEYTFGFFIGMKRKFNIMECVEIEDKIVQNEPQCTNQISKMYRSWNKGYQAVI